MGVQNNPNNGAGQQQKSGPVAVVVLPLLVVGSKPVDFVVMSGDGI